jgi:serine/threonine protein kinase
VWAAVSHPQIVPFQRTGWWDGRPYLMLEYIPQGSLATRLAGHPYPVREALRLVAQLAEIISYLHRQGVVHANLKPSNVLFAPDGIPRLTDFHLTGGLFQAQSPANVAEAGYLAPELADDPLADPRPYTDIYGLGVILYELLTGRRPFAESGAEGAGQVPRSDGPVPPSHINPDVTPAVEACCLRCLHKNPWRRYYRSYALMRRLRHLCDGVVPPA